MENLTPEQQLQEVQKQYEQRRESSSETEPEHETMSHVVQDQIQQHEPAFQAQTHAPRSVSGSLNDEDQAKIQQWVNDAFSKSLWQAIKDAKNSGDMALLDAFHAALSGELYDQLVASKKLKELS